MKISVEVVGANFASSVARVDDIRRRAVERLEAQRAERDRRMMAEQAADEAVLRERGGR